MPNTWMQKLDRAIDAQRQKIVRVRRDLHMYPEPSGREVKTTRYLVKLLQQTRCHVQIGPRGCGVIADNTLENTRIGLRADIDALRIQDKKKNVPYRSRVPDVMHACGHDGHTATVLGAVLGLLECDQVLPWPVHWRAIFQPAEETNRGAKDMIAFGALKNVCGLLSLHLDPSRPAGTVGIRKGVLTANCAEIKICIRGRGGHAARPRETRDPIAAAAQVIIALYQSLPRNVDTYDPVVISIGHISAGENPNVIPDQAALRGTLRTLSDRSQAHAMDHILKIANSIANLTDTQIDVHFLTGPPSVNNDPTLTKLIRQNATDLLGQTHVQSIAKPSMGGEDFANYLDHVPGSLFRLGCMPARGSAPPLHAPDFDIDERALVIGAKILARSVVNYFDPAQKKTEIAMTRLEFNPSKKPTVGVEIELALVDANTMALCSKNAAILNRIPGEYADKIKPELMQCYVEINTDVCEGVSDVEADLKPKLQVLSSAATAENVQLYWSGTHPFSTWREQKITPNDRYMGLVNLLQDTARQLVTFGLHVHVGVNSGDKAIMICDRILRYLPVLLALSCNSPFWEGRVTGLHSWRSKVMEGLPTAGLPPLMRNWSEYVWLINHLIDTGYIESIREIWWDVRPHHAFGTVEVRICDIPGTLEDTLGLTALIQCLICNLSDQIDQGIYQHDSHPMLIRQNKWHASRYGIEAKLVDSTSHDLKSVPQMTEELVEDLLPMAEQLNCVPFLEHVLDMAHQPTWAQRQMDLLTLTGDPAEVVRRLINNSSH